MSLATWIILLIFGIPLVLTWLVFWIATCTQREIDDFDVPEAWGSQDVDQRLK